MGEHDIEVGREVGEFGELGVEVGAVHHEAGHRCEVGEHGRQEGRADGGEGEERDLAARMVAELVPQGRRAFECRRDLGGAACECVSGAREHQAPAAAGGERHPGLAFEHLQLLGDGRGGAARGLGDRGDAATLGEFPEQVESANIHVVKLHPQ